MNHELFNYSLMASVLGISIVFISLLGLSLLMVLLKALFQDKEEKNVPAAGKASAAPAASAQEIQEGNDWIMATVAAYLIQEDLPAPSAASWVSRGSEVVDPWMNRAAFDRNPV